MLTAVALATGLFVNSALTPNAAQLLQASWEKPHVVGHRGAAAYQPENTLASFREAVKIGADATECDVHLSQDGVPFILHDATLDRTTRLKGRIDQTESATLIQAGVPTLEETILALKNKIVFVIEIKAGEGVEAKVTELIKKHGTAAQTIAFSFNQAIVARVEQLMPELPTVWLQGPKPTVETTPTIMAQAKSLGIDAIGVSYKSLEPEFAETLRAAHVPLFVWTVPPGPEVERLKGLRVNFIITDHPRDVLPLLGRKPTG